MQVFLPSRSFRDTAKILDSQRLNKQITECKQIYASLTGLAEPHNKPSRPTTAWIHHPAVVMWRGAEHLLCMYAIFMRLEATNRGIADNTDMLNFFDVRMKRHEYKVPRWMQDERMLDRIIHSHRCNLARKNWAHYFPQFPELKASEVFVTPYVWPNDIII